MTRRCVQHLADGETIDEVYLVTDKQLRANRNGNLYLQLELRDRTGAISARLWNAGEHLFRSFEEGDFPPRQGQGAAVPGLAADDPHPPRPASGRQVDLADFLPHTEQDVGKLFERLRNLLLRLGNPHLRALAECFLMDDDFVEAFCKVPAGVRNHHAYLGGLAGARRHPARRRRPPGAALSRTGPRPAC